MGLPKITNLANFDLAIALWEMLKTPMTREQAEAALGRHKGSLKPLLRKLEAAKRVELCGRERHPCGNRYSYIWRRVEKGPIGPWSTLSNPSSGASPISPKATTGEEETKVAP